MKRVFKILLVLIVLANSCSIQKRKTRNPLQASLAVKSDALLGEGAFWNHETQRLYWVDIEGKALHICNLKNGSSWTYTCPSRIGTVVPSTDPSRAVVALENGIHFFDVEKGKFEMFSPLEADPEVRLNDGKCDPAGRLWVGSMHLEQTTGAASLYMIDKTGTSTVKVPEVSISNGIVWTKDKKTMYYIDTPTGQVVAYDYNIETGAISNKKVAIDIPPTLGYPDGMCIDAKDNVWIGLWNGNSVVCFDPRSGKLIQQISVPAHNVTSCAFGGRDLKTLYITTSSLDMTDEERKKYPLAGSVFEVRPGVKGVKSSFFKL